MKALEEQIAEWEEKSYCELSDFVAELLNDGSGGFKGGKEYDRVCKSFEDVWEKRRLGEQGIFVMPKVLPTYDLDGRKYEEYDEDERISWVELLVPSLPLSKALGISERTLQRWKRGDHEDIYVDGDGKGNYGFVFCLNSAIKKNKPIHPALRKYIPDGLRKIYPQDSDWDAIA